MNLIDEKSIHFDLTVTEANIIHDALFNTANALQQMLDTGNTPNRTATKVFQQVVMQLDIRLMGLITEAAGER